MTNAVHSRKPILTLARVLLMCGIGTLFIGCASMTRDGSRQTIMIRTEPPGATIYQDGVAIGRTPELVEIERSSHPEIELGTSKGKESFLLPTRYRWRKSFWHGLVFVTYAPIAWLVDIVSGTAWDVRDDAPIPVKLAEQDRMPKVLRSPPNVVIAPPRSSSVAMSDEGGRALERSLREKLRASSSKWIVRPYEETLPLFIEQDYEFEGSNKNSQRRLQRALQAEVLYESYVEPDDSGWILRSEAYDLYSEKQWQGPSLRLGRDAEGPRLFGIGFGLKPWWSRVLPDTIGLDFVDEKLQVTMRDVTYDLVPVHGEAWWAKGLQYLNAINILSTPDRRREFGSRWEFSAVPSLSLSRKNLKAKGLPADSGLLVESEPEFVRWSVAGGYGLEIGYLFGRHYLYFDFIPIFNWSQISWRQNAQDKVATRTAVTARAEIGYTYLFDSNWVIRIFSRSQGENTELWRDVLIARFGEAYAPTAAQAVVAGVTFGYRFDADRFQATQLLGK